jgi:ABC-type sugar transport system ATPase subunit
LLIHSNNLPVAGVDYQDLCKRFPLPGGNGQSIEAVRDVTLSVAPGERLAVIGPSASGKTTLLRLTAGLEIPDSGRIAIGGLDQAGIPPGRRGVAMVFQSSALYPHLSVRDNLGFGLKLRRIPASEMKSRVAEIAGRLGIEDCLSRRPSELSGGQRQRVALGRALIRRPAVLLLDEPFANLDAPLRRELRRDLLQLHMEFNPTLILVTHDQAEALALGQRVAVMREGRIEQAAAPGELQGRPANAFVAAFLDSRPL